MTTATKITYTSAAGDLDEFHRHFDEAQVAQTPVVMAQTPRSLVSAYATLIMDPAGDTLSIDVLRHRPQIREGTLELLILALMQWAQRHEFRFVNLGAGFPGLEEDGAMGGVSRALLVEDGEPPTMARLQEVIRELLLDIGRFMAERLTPAPQSSGWLRTAS